jgi:hypothetical protein
MLSAGAEKRSNEILNTLSDQDKKVLIALPYRVGLFVSHSDSDGGEEAEDREIQTLNNILIEIQQDFCKSEIMQKILIETVAHKDQWASWNKNIEDVPDECTHAADLLVGLVEQQGDLMSVKETLVDIGVAVAMAFRESGNSGYPGESPVADAVKSMRNVLARFIPSLRVDDRFTHLNISRTERGALIKLHNALS